MKKILFILILSFMFVGCAKYGWFRAINYDSASKISNDVYSDILLILDDEIRSFSDVTENTKNYEYIELIKKEREFIKETQKEKLEAIANFYLR